MDECGKEERICLLKIGRGPHVGGCGKAARIFGKYYEDIHNVLSAPHDSDDIFMESMRPWNCAK